MINLDWRKSVEIIGVLALVISLLFVGLQMKQTNEVAFLELDTAMVGTAVDIAELISSNPDVWVKGNAGEEPLPSKPSTLNYCLP